MKALRAALAWGLPVLLIVLLASGPFLRDRLADPAPPLPPLDRDPPVVCDSLYFVFGCFWTTEAWFGALEGVIRTRTGYAGGRHPSPDWRNARDHAETIEVVYDPVRLPVDSLLLGFLRLVEPGAVAGDPRYAPALFARTEEPLARTRALWNGLHRDMPAPRTERLSGFHPAEAFNQKHGLRIHPDAGRAWSERADRERFLERSTAAARLHGWLAGFGETREIRRDLPRCGLAPELESRLEDLLLEDRPLPPERPGAGQ